MLCCQSCYWISSYKCVHFFVLKSFEDPLYPVLRHVSTSGLRAYGTGMAQLEKTIQEVLQDMTEDLNSKAGQPINSHQLCNSFVSSIMVFLVSQSNNESACDFKKLLIMLCWHTRATAWAKAQAYCQLVNCKISKNLDCKAILSVDSHLILYPIVINLVDMLLLVVN